MITYSHHRLIDVEDHFNEMSEIAFKSVDLEVGYALDQIKMFSRRGCDCVLAFDGDRLIGYVIHGEAGKLFDWSRHLHIKIALAKVGIKRVDMACHIHLLKEYWGNGTSTQLFVEYSKGMLRNGAEYTLLWGYATDQLTSYSLSRVGSRVLDGVVDTNGRQVGVRDIRVFIDRYDRVG